MITVNADFKHAIADKARLSMSEFHSVLAILPDSVIICDQEDKIMYMNAATFQLFELAADFPYWQFSYQDFLRKYELQSESVSGDLVKAMERMQTLKVPGGNKVVVCLWHYHMLEEEQKRAKKVSVWRNITHWQQTMMHLQRVQQAVFTLTAAVTQVSEYFDEPIPSETPILSPPVLLIAQQLVNVIHHVLECWRVALWAVGATEHMHYVAGSGFTPEQEQIRRSCQNILSVDVLGEEILSRFRANQEIIVSSDKMKPPTEYAAEFDVAANFLLVPIELKSKIVGGLAISQIDEKSSFHPDDIRFAKAVVAQAALLVECILCLQEQTETKTKLRVLQEVNRLSTEFLTLASHELRTPLTGMYGNLQLAQRRLTTLQKQAEASSQQEKVNMRAVQQSLASASQSAQLQQRMINQLIDDARYQAKSLQLCTKRSDLLVVIRDAIARTQAFIGGRTIQLEVVPPHTEVSVLLDIERIGQVLDVYLVNALHAAPVGSVVLVRVVAEEGKVCVFVHDEGPGIPHEEQEHLWERFYRGKGTAIQHELDLSCGLGLYLCRAFVELHDGQVGVESEPEKGSTFWFCLPF